MADDNGNGGTGSTPPGGNAGGQPNSQPNADMVSVPRSEYDKMTRYGDQVKGFQPYHQRASAAGFKTAEDFDRFDPWLKQIAMLEKRGVKADMLGRMFSDDADADLNDGKKEQPEFDRDAFKKEIMAEYRKEAAMSEFKSLSAKEKDYVAQAMKDIYGEDAVDEWTAEQRRYSLSHYMDSKRDTYPTDHPLHKDVYLQPFSEKQVKDAVEYFKKRATEAKGKSMAEKADAVIASEGKKAPPSAGKSGGNGAPTNNTEKRPYGKPSKETIEAAYQAKKDARGRGST